MEDAAILRDATLHLESGICRGDILIVGERIEAIGEFDAPSGARERDLGGRAVIPGLVDLQLNGFAGFEVQEAKPQALRTIVRELARGGCTSVLLTMISAPRERYERLGEALATMGQPEDGARVLGVHLEGPFLNPRYTGAHSPDLLRQPSAADAEELLEVMSGLVRLWTLAPELPGAAELIELLRSRGIVVAAGHSALSYDAALEWFRRGVALVTHLFNAMTPLHHRAPGLAAAALLDGHVRFSLIADGYHIDPACVRLAVRLGAERLILVTDAGGAASMPDGLYEVGGEPAQSENGAVRRPDGRLAGSALTALQALQNVCAWTGLSLSEALPAMTTRPADLLGRSDIGRLVPGAFADLVVLDDDGELLETQIGGKTVCLREAA
jgi:N-acetylglucosamine-6-phosphate deacetylase